MAPESARANSLYQLPQLRLFILWCAGGSRHERLVRKHVPDSDPGWTAQVASHSTFAASLRGYDPPNSSLVRKCALQSTSMPALHRRILPNCRPMVDGGMRKCSAGACPPQGSGWGVAESAVPIRCTKPQLRLFIPWCAGGSRYERLLRKTTSRPQKTESAGPVVRCVPLTLAASTYQS